MRASTMVVSLYCYYYAVSVLPLSDAVLLISSSPLFVPLAGFLLYQFPVKSSVLIALVAGFVSVVIILQPDGSIPLVGGVFGLTAGVAGAVGAVLVWRMPADEDAVRITFFLALFCALIFALPAIAVAEWPSWREFGLLLLLGLASTAAHFLFCYACLVAPADRIISLEYVTIVFASAIAWIIWDERIDAMFIVGAALIIGANVVVLRTSSQNPKEKSQLSNKRFETRTIGSVVENIRN